MIKDGCAILWRKFNLYNCFHSAPPSIRQETIFLNPLLDKDSLYKDFNDTYDYNTYSDYDNYETSDTDNGDESFTMSYYEEQDIKNVNDRETRYDANSTNFLTDSTIDEHFYTSSTSSESETTASTTIESDTVEGILYFLYIPYTHNNYSA